LDLGTCKEGFMPPTTSQSTDTITPRSHSSGAASAEQTAAEAVEHATGKIRTLYEKGKGKAVEWQDGVEHYVREKPLQSILIAAGTGLVLGLLIGRRRG
jgi:ElaB/YqjD/DUF883 family membrane-anchored ribosome-binding protein